MKPAKYLISIILFATFSFAAKSPRRECTFNSDCKPFGLECCLGVGVRLPFQKSSNFVGELTKFVFYAGESRSVRSAIEVVQDSTIKLSWWSIKYLFDFFVELEEKSPCWCDSTWHLRSGTEAWECNSDAFLAKARGPVQAGTFTVP